MSLSIFAALQNTLGDQLPTVSLTKATLVHLSHTLEDFVLKRKMPAMLFTGFQESSHWRTETERYRELADVAMQVCIFAGKPLPADQTLGAIQIELEGEDPLRQEWFVAILADEFSVILCGLDNLRPADREAHRTFDTVWSFDPTVVGSVLDVLEEVIANYRPDVLPQLLSARRTYPLGDPNVELLNTFMQELLRFEDKLQYELMTRTHDLELSEALYRSVVTNAPVVLLLLDMDGYVKLATGTREPEVFTQGNPTVGKLIFPYIRHIPQMEATIRQLMDGETIATTLYISADTVFDFRGRVFRGGELADNIICVVVDISERVRREQATLEGERLQVALEKERELSEIRKQLMMTLSHELRTPLATIQTGTDLLGLYHERLTTEKRQERVNTIQQQIRRLVGILEDIDMVVRSDQDILSLELKHMDLEPLIRQAIDEAHEGTNHNVVMDFEPGKCFIYADPRWFRYIMRNLLSNAAKYSSPSTPITVRVRQESTQTAIAVQDHGIGIPSSDLERLFEPFYRGSNVGTIGGTGLGLVIARNIVAAHNGTLHINSEENVGTTVTVELPMHPSANP